MKNTFNKIILLGVSALALASCNLDLYPTTAIVYDEGQVALQKASDVSSFLVGVRTNFRGTQSGIFYLLDDVMCDGFNATIDYGNNYGAIHRTDEDFTAADSDILDFWAYYYVAIKNYNIAIAAVHQLQSDGSDLAKDDNTNLLIGESYLYRAAAYMQLARHFGPTYAKGASELCVPLVTVYDQAARPARATVAEVYNQIKADLDSSYVYLGGVESENIAMVPTADLVNAYYARYYLDVADYANAAEKAVEVINTQKYTLATDEKSIQNEYGNDTGTEPIMQMYASLSEQPNAINIYTGLTSTNSGLSYAPYFLPSGKLVDQYEASDIRLQYWFDQSDYPLYFQGSNRVNTGVYVFTKRLGNAAYQSSGIPSGRNAIKPIMIGELYLIAAEAYQKQGQAKSAVTYLNALQEARGASLTAANDEYLQREWFRETVGDGLRMSCLKRWGVGFTTRYAQQAALDDQDLMTQGDYFDTRSMEASDYHFNWPIPNYELKVNPNLVQNTGYAAVTE